MLIEAIDTVNILDPACGSGAFPMGILHKLVFILGKLDPHNDLWRDVQRQKAVADTEEAFKLGDKKEREERLLQINDIFERNASDYGRKLYLIENCIYGVDIQPVAVQIAKLRFFISLVVDQHITDEVENRGILPLPNLETKFVAANTLLGIEKPKQMALRNPEITVKEKELAEVRSKHFRARTPRTKEKYRDQDKQLRGEIGGLLQKEGMLRNEDVTRLAGWDPYNQNNHAEFFDTEWMFGLESGFDVVIGNPPYVRQEKIKDLKPALQKQYDCYTGVADLYVYFIEGGYHWLKAEGVLCYICSNKYFRAGYGKKLRGFLGKQTTVRQVIDFGDAPVFTAIAYPSIIVFQKTAPDGNRLTAFNWEPGPPVTEFESVFAANKFRMPQTDLTSDGWRLEQKEVLALLAKLRGVGKPLGEYVEGRFYRGILTGLNEAFVVDRATRDRLIAEHSSSADILKPYLRGRDVKRWQVQPQDLWLIFPRHGTDIDKYPAIKKHLLEYKERLMPHPKVWEGAWLGRKPGSYKWFEIQDNIAYWEEFEKPKIIYPDIAQDREFAYDRDGYYLANTLYLLPTNDLWLVGLLNSKVVFWFYSQISTKIRGGFVRFIAQYVSEIPVPASENNDHIENLSRQILAAKQAHPTADVSALEREIDQLVYALYGLEPTEIALIEGKDVDSQVTIINAKNVLDVSVASGQLSAPPLIFTGQVPQGGFPDRLKRVQALGKQNSITAIQDLTAALTDQNVSISWLAASFLRQIGGEDVVNVLKAFLSHTENKLAQEKALKILSELNASS